MAPAELAHAYGRLLVHRGRGGIILVSSAAAFAPVAYTANYAAAKAYLASLGQALHYELKGSGIDVLTLAPGPVRTEGADGIDGIDFTKLPVLAMQPGPVVRAGLRGLGRKPPGIPGALNKANDFAGKYLTPRRAQTALFGALVGRALHEKPRRGQTGGLVQRALCLPEISSVQFKRHADTRGRNSSCDVNDKMVLAEQLNLQPPACSVAVVITSLEDLHLLVVGPVYQPVLVIDSAGPVAGEVSFEGLGLAYPGERVALDLTDQAGDPCRHLPVCAQPVQEVLPGAGVEVDTSHYSPAKASSSSMVLTTAAWPALSRATASMSRRALAGDRSR